MIVAFQFFFPVLEVIMQILLLLQKTFVMNYFVMEQGYWILFLK